MRCHREQSKSEDAESIVIDFEGFLLARCRRETLYVMSEYADGEYIRVVNFVRTHLFGHWLVEEVALSRATAADASRVMVRPNGQRRIKSDKFN